MNLMFVLYFSFSVFYEFALIILKSRNVYTTSYFNSRQLFDLDVLIHYIKFFFSFQNSKTCVHIVKE